MNKLLALLALVPLCLLGAPSAAAQSPLSLEVRGNLGLPTGDFADAGAGLEAETGFGFSAGANLRLLSAVEVYGLYRYTDFGCAECILVGLDDSAVDQGGEAGVRLSLPTGLLAGLGAAPWVSAGALFNQLSLSRGEERLTSEASAGFSVGAGADLPLGQVITVRPGLHYRSYTAEFEFPQTELPTRDVQVSHLTLDVGLVYRF